MSLVFFGSIIFFQAELDAGIKLIIHMARNTPQANEFANLRVIWVPFDKFNAFVNFFRGFVDSKLQLSDFS